MQQIPKEKRVFELSGNARWIDPSKAVRTYEDADGKQVSVFKSHMAIAVESKYDKVREESALLVLTKSKNTYYRLKPMKWVCLLTGLASSFFGATYLVPSLFLDPNNAITDTTSKLSKEFGIDYA